MKVALVYFGRKGGGPVYSLEIAKRLKEKVELNCFVSKQMENIGIWRSLGIKLSIFETYTNKTELLLSFFNLKKFIEIKKQINEFKPDVIYFPFFHLWLPLISWFFPKIPKVYTCHDVLLHLGENNIFLKWWQDILMNTSERIIILSEVFKKNIEQAAISSEKIDVIPHGIFDYYVNLEGKNSVEIKKNNKTILFFGRIVDYKGLDILLKAFGKIKMAVPETQLWIVGSGELYKYKKLLAQDAIVVENKWVPDNEVKDYFTKSAILVCPYKEASQSGLVPLAYSFKMPVVATKVGGLVEQIEDGKTGILVECGDSEALVRACVELLSDQNKCQRMGQAGYEKAVREFSWERVSQMVLDSLVKASSN